jgi:hypothetical protein
MPHPPGKKPTRYRVKTTRSGKKVRLGFRGGKVAEAKRLKKKR